MSDEYFRHSIEIMNEATATPPTRDYIVKSRFTWAIYKIYTFIKRAYV